MTYEEMTAEQQAAFRKAEKELSKNFPLHVVEWKPQSVNKDETKAQAVCFTDPRVYEDRLTDVVPGWQRNFPFVSPDGKSVTCRLTIMGISREATGQADAKDTQPLACAEAMAFKRACAAFQLGANYYHLPLMWCPYDKEHKKLTTTPSLPKWYTDDMFSYQLHAAPILIEPGQKATDAPVEPVKTLNQPGPAPAAASNSNGPHKTTSSGNLTGEGLHLCKVCQAPLFGGVDAKGKPYTAETLYRLSMKQCQSPLCYEHLIKSTTTNHVIDDAKLTPQQNFALLEAIIKGLDVEDFKAKRVLGQTFEQAIGAVFAAAPA